VQDDNFIGLLHGIARRSVFVIDKNGKVVYTWLADQPGVEPPYDQVQAAVQKVNA
jgi:peroxiredoxin